MNRRVATYLLAPVLPLLIFSFCSRPKEVLNRKNMEKLMYDIYMAEAMIENDYSNFDTPEKKEALINKVFEKHKTSQAQWDTSLSWYSDRIEIYLKMNDSVKARLRRRQQTTERIMSLELSREDWIQKRFQSSSYIPPSYSFDELDSKNGFRFILDSTEINRRINNPEFCFSFLLIGIPPGAKPNLHTWLMLEYKDTTMYRTQSLFENKSYCLHGSKYIADDTIRRIEAFVRLQDTTGIYRNIRMNRIFFGNRTDSVPKPPTFSGETP